MRRSLRSQIGGTELQLLALLPHLTQIGTTEPALGLPEAVDTEIYSTPGLIKTQHDAPTDRKTEVF